MHIPLEIVHYHKFTNILYINFFRSVEKFPFDRYHVSMKYILVQIEDGLQILNYFVIDFN